MFEESAAIPRQTVTMQDIATRIGVSKAAVSAVLSGKQNSNIGVSDVMRQRIQEAAREMRYRPNAVARSLSARATNVIGYYSSWQIDARNDFDSELISGLLRGCHEQHKNLLLFDTFSIRNEERATGSPHFVSDAHADMFDGKVDGLVFRCHPNDPILMELRQENLPAIALADVHEGFPVVVVDEADAFRQMCAHLHERGHRRVLFRGVRGPGAGNRRYMYFAAEAAKHGMTVLHDAESVSYEPSEQEKAWLLLPAEERPTAVACWSDPAALYTLRYLDRRQIRVQDEVSVIGFNGIPEPMPPLRRLSTVGAHWAGLAQTAVALLQQRIAGQDIPELTVIPVELIPGETT